MARQKNSVDDTEWPEVIAINSYAIFLGYLLMSVRGLGLLVLTWTTVVLLGGFVSMLQKNDFWSLTVITLVQTAGVFDFLIKDKAKDVAISFKGLLYSIVGAVERLNINRKRDKKNEDQVEISLQGLAVSIVALALWLVQVLSLVILLCPVAVLYVVGLYLSAGISLWRLIQQDYGNADGGTNLKPALNVLYSLAVAQGMVYGYRAIHNFAARTELVEQVAKHYSLEPELVSEYLDETVVGCAKDSSFARGRNLVAYGVDLLTESKSRYGYISGVMILGTTIIEEGQPGLMKQLLTRSASFSHVVQRLLETFGPRSPYSTKIRVQAASIVANVASCIRLDQFPAQGVMIIQCILSLLETFEEYSWRPNGYERCSFLPKEYEQDWLLDEEDLKYLHIDNIPAARDTDNKKQESDSTNDTLQGYKELVVRGLRILQGLAVDEDNCRVISNSEGLLPKTVAPLISDQLHVDHHVEWSSIAEGSLEVMKRLISTPGLVLVGTKTTKLTKEISSAGNIQVMIIRALEAILDCLNCQVLLKRQAVEVFLDLSVDTAAPSSIMPGGSNNKMFLWLLLYISLVPEYHIHAICGSTHHLLEKRSCIRKLAGEKLQHMLSSQTAGASALRSVGDVIGSLTTTVADVENNAQIRIHAAKILEDLCRYYTKNDENLKELKKAMTDVMPEVLKQIVCWRCTREEGTQAATDLEHGVGGSHHQQQKDEKHWGIQLQKALVALCRQIDFQWMDKDDQDLTCRFNQIAARTPDKTFRALVFEAHWRTS